MTAKEAIKHAESIAEYCKAQKGCQNCIFKKFGASEWNCHIEAFDIREVLCNIQAKKKNRGYI